MNNSIQFIEWTNTNGKTIRGSAHIVNQESANPWFIICHGLTGHRLGPGYLFVKLSRFLSSHGFSSLRFDFCGSGESDGYFHEMSVETMVSDLLTVISILKEKHNPHPLILIGHSFGGMIAALCTQQIAFDGLVLISPVGNPNQIMTKRQDLLKSAPNNSGYIEYGPHEMSISAIKSFTTVDPVNTLANNFKGKLLLIQGDNDLSIPIAESQCYIESAHKADILTDYQLLNGTDHNFSRVNDVKMLCQIILSWARERFQ